MPHNPLLQIKKIAGEAGAAGALLTFLPDIRWATGFTGSNAWLVVLPEAVHFLTDGRYTTQAGAEVAGAEVHIAKGTFAEYLGEAGWLAGRGPVLFQADHLTVAQFLDLKERLPDVDWRPAKELLVGAVAVKTEAQVNALRKAQAVTEGVFAHLLTWLRPGQTEREVAAEIVYQHLQRGASAMSFDPIVASGPNGALPHARPTDRSLRAGELVVIDMGGYTDGYASDMTRTIALGEVDAAAQQAYAAVLEAQTRALEAAEAGMSARALDAVARESLTAAGYEQYFTHSLGHGVGLQVHEWPRVSYQVDYPLPAGAAVTIEPGVYLPGRFGVRIEDVIVLREGGSENLTQAPKHLITL